MFVQAARLAVEILEEVVDAWPCWKELQELQKDAENYIKLVQGFAAVTIMYVGQLANVLILASLPSKVLLNWMQSEDWRRVANLIWHKQHCYNLRVMSSLACESAVQILALVKTRSGPQQTAPPS